MRSPESELEALREQNLFREARFIDRREGTSVGCGGDRLVNFSSNDYLGLACHPTLAKAAGEAAENEGAGASASRLIYGGCATHRDLERGAAEFFGKGSALSFANGYCAATGCLGALLRRGDTAILDKRCHASLIDGARLSGATIRVFPHNNLEKLERLLRGACQPDDEEHRVLVITESVFSMDGDLCPLEEIVELKQRYGALLLLDEAHAFGVLGPGGRGLAHATNLVNEIDVLMATFGKAAGGAGGCVVADAPWIDLIANKARSFIYSTAPPPAQAAAANAGLELLASEEGRRRRDLLRNNVALLASSLGLSPPPAAILPFIIGDERAALDAADSLWEQGFLVPAIRYPTVARRTARLRITLSAAHQHHDIERLAEALRSIPLQQTTSSA